MSCYMRLIGCLCMLHSLLPKRSVLYSHCVLWEKCGSTLLKSWSGFTYKHITYFPSERTLAERAKKDERKRRNCQTNDLNPRSNETWFMSFPQSKLGNKSKYFSLLRRQWIESVIQVKIMWIPGQRSLRICTQKCHEAVLKGRMEERKTTMKVRGEKTFKVTLALFPHGCKTFQCILLQHIHCSNQFYQRNQYGWNIGLLWVATFSWGPCERSNVFS